MRRFTLVHTLYLGATCGFLLAAAGVGCGGGDNMMMMMMPPPPQACTADKVMGSDNKLATDSLKLPKSTGGMSYSYDFDGDGKLENQLKNLTNVISLSGLDIQKNVDDAIASGESVILADLKAADLMSSMCASVTMNLAKAPAMGDPKPKFDGTDTFKVGDAMAVTLFGAITNGTLNTLDSKNQTAANEQKVNVLLPLMGMNLPLTLRGAHVQGTVVMEGGIVKIKNGAIHGVLSQKDIDSNIIPIVADLLTKLIHTGTTGMPPMPDDTAKAIIGLFEQKAGAASKAKCMANINDCCGPAAPMGMMGHPDTCKILVQEVKDSSIGGVLAPDVQVLDDAGNWKPVPGGKMANGMSVGVGFTSVKASF